MVKDKKDVHIIKMPDGRMLVPEEYASIVQESIKSAEDDDLAFGGGYRLGEKIQIKMGDKVQDVREIVTRASGGFAAVSEKPPPAYKVNIDNRKSKSTNYCNGVDYDSR